MNVRTIYRSIRNKPQRVTTITFFRSAALEWKDYELNERLL
jgi:hypothetical protein